MSDIHTATATATPSAEEIEAADRKFGEAPERLDMSVREAECLSIVLARRSASRGPYDLVVGLANGALLPTKVVADEIGAPFEIIQVRRKGSRYKQKLVKIKNFLRIPSSLILWGPFKPMWDLFQAMTGQLEEGHNAFAFPVSGRRVLLVDDCIVTGGSVRHVAGKLREAGAKEVVVAVLGWSDMPGRETLEPDIHLYRPMHTYPWSNHSEALGEFEAWLTRRGIALWE